MLPRYQETPTPKPTQWIERQHAGLSGKLRMKGSGSPWEVSESFAVGTVSTRHSTRNMDPKRNGDTNASALRTGWPAGSRRKCAKRSINM